MSYEADINTMISANIVTNTMQPKITPEMLRDTLLSMNSKLVCKDSTNWVVQSMQAIITALSSDITSLQNDKATKSEVTSVSQALTLLINGKADASALTAKADKTYVDTELAKAPKVFYGTVQKTGAKFWVGSATVTGGNAVFNLVDAQGNAWFNNVFLESIQPVLRNPSAPPAFGAPSLSTDKKTLTIPANKTAAGIVILSISVLGAVIAANGDTVTVMILGE